MGACGVRHGCRAAERLRAVEQPSPACAARAGVGLAVFGLAGLVLGASGVAGGSWETPITVTGSLLLASTHLLNLRLRRRGGTCAS